MLSAEKWEREKRNGDEHDQEENRELCRGGEK